MSHKGGLQDECIITATYYATPLPTTGLIGINPHRFRCTRGSHERTSIPDSPRCSRERSVIRDKIRDKIRFPGNPSAAEYICAAVERLPETLSSRPSPPASVAAAATSPASSRGDGGEIPFSPFPSTHPRGKIPAMVRRTASKNAFKNSGGMPRFCRECGRTGRKKGGQDRVVGKVARRG